MRLSISAGLVLFAVLVLASALPVVRAGRDNDDAEFRLHVERTLAEHSARLDVSEQLQREFRATNMPERLARVEEAYVIGVRLQFSILLTALGILITTLLPALRKKKNDNGQ